MSTAKEPWNNWYHCIGNTYGTWLPGDPKGFRTRHHREHVEGDYRNPPKVDYGQRHQKSQQLLNRPPVYLSVIQRARAADEWVRSLLKNEIELICLSIDRIHFHALARFPDRAPRKWLGIAKKESSHYMKQDDLASVGGLWASRFKCLPITDRQHQLRVVRYILAHKGKGAAVWFQGRRL